MPNKVVLFVICCFASLLLVYPVYYVASWLMWKVEEFIHCLHFAFFIPIFACFDVELVMHSSTGRVLLSQGFSLSGRKRKKASKVASVRIFRFLQMERNRRILRTLQVWSKQLKSFIIYLFLVIYFGNELDYILEMFFVVAVRFCGRVWFTCFCSRLLIFGSFVCIIQTFYC